MYIYIGDVLVFHSFLLDSILSLLYNIIYAITFYIYKIFLWFTLCTFYLMDYSYLIFIYIFGIILWFFLDIILLISNLFNTKHSPINKNKKYINLLYIEKFKFNLKFLYTFKLYSIFI